MTRALYAEHALLPSGWEESVLIRWNALGEITEVSAGDSCPADAERVSGPVISAMPNIHSHAFQRAFAGMTEYRAHPSDSFWSWRSLMYDFAAKVGPDELGPIAKWLYIEMLKAGYTSVCEFQYVHHQPDGARYTNPAELSARVVAAAEEAGIGITMLPVLYMYSNFGKTAPRDDQRRFLNTPDQLLQIISELRRQLPEGKMRRYGVAPHSLRAVSCDALSELLSGLDSQDNHAPIHIHIAEQTAEVEGCMASEGARPVQLLYDRFDVDGRWCLVHATHVDKNETACMAKSGAVVALCPTTEANLGDGLFPAGDYLDAAGRIGLGSDSHIGVDWRSELRLLEYGQRLKFRRRNVLASECSKFVADWLYDLAIEGGAAATSRNVGQLRVGNQADMLVLDGRHLAIADRDSSMWLSGVVFAEHGPSPINDVFAAGRKVVQGGKHRDEDSAQEEYRRAVKRMMKN